jgi:DNA-binding NtrC family response regulator
VISLTFFSNKDLTPIQRSFPDNCEIVIGRGASESLRVERDGDVFTVQCPLPSLSERHARVSVANGRARIEDLRSRNGTMVRLDPGEAHVAGDKPIWLGPDLAIRIDGDRWQLPLDLATWTASELRDFLQRRLASRGAVVEFAGAGADSLPVCGEELHVVVRPASAQRTIDSDDTAWVRFVVSAYNAARDALGTDAGWRFTAVSPARRRALEQARRAARADLPTLLLGPTGVGKEVLAQDIHDHSAARDGAFVAVNCASLSAERLESELFGHVRGAFTGAHADHRGLVEIAEGGTLFLDEIGEMSPAVQAKLLRFVSDRGEYRRMGDSRIRHARVRIIAATHRDLLRADGKGSFRADLYFRLSGIRIDIPAPMSEDIERIAFDTLVTNARDRELHVDDASARTIAKDAAQRTWPGNARQVRFAIERCVQLRDPRRSWLEDWAESVALESATWVPTAFSASASASTSTSTRLGLEAQPARVARLVSDALFLAAATQIRTRADLARALGVTYQAVDSRLGSLRVQIDQPAAIASRRDECIRELRSLAATSAEIQVLFKSVLEP